MATSYTLVSCLAFSSTLKMTGDMFLKRRFTFTELHCILSLKMELYIITALRTSDPTSFSVALQHEVFPRYNTKFHKDWFKHSKVVGKGGDTDTQTA
jgi:hypothetical protein